MANISEYNGIPIIELTLDTEFIKTYNLQFTLNKASIYDSFVIDLGKSYSFSIPTNLPPHNVTYSKSFLKGFFDLFKLLIDEHEDLASHSDNLFFLAHTFKMIGDEKRKETAKYDHLRKNGKLLCEFIKVPFPVYTKFNIHILFDDHDLYYSNVQTLLLMYLNIITKKLPEHFKDSNEKLDYNKIDKQTEHKLIRRIIADKNIAIELSADKYLVISKNITTKFIYRQSSKTRAFSITEEQQSESINKLIVESLFNEQKEAKTDLYLRLLDYDFYSRDTFKEVINTVNNYSRSGHHTHNLKNLYDVLIDYFNKQNILARKSVIETRQIRNDFIYQYYILLGLFLNSKRELEAYESLDQINKKLKEFNLKRRKSKNHATKSLTDSFKNLDRNNIDFLRSNS